MTPGDSTFVVHGLRELALNLEQFPEKLKRKALLTALRASGRVVRDIARARVPVKSGALRKSIRVTVRIDRFTGNPRARVIAGRRVKKDDPYYALFVERGTKAHEIRPKGKKSLFIAGLFAEQVNHPGARARPYLEPALDQGAQAAIEAMRVALAAEIEAMGDLGNVGHVT